MVSCMILYHPTVTSLTKCKIARAMFHETKFEIEVIERNTVIIYVWKVHRSSIWQSALDFESANVMTGYGFGKTKSNAQKEAMRTLLKRIALSGLFSESSSSTVSDHHSLI